MTPDFISVDSPLASGQRRPANPFPCSIFAFFQHSATFGSVNSVTVLVYFVSAAPLQLSFILVLTHLTVWPFSRLPAYPDVRVNQL